MISLIHLMIVTNCFVIAAIALAKIYDHTKPVLKISAWKCGECGVNYAPWVMACRCNSIKDLLSNKRENINRKFRDK